MNKGFALEVVRQSLRALTVYLLAAGMPPELAPLFEHPHAAELVIAFIFYAIAEVGWVIAKFREWWVRNKA